MTTVNERHDEAPKSQQQSLADRNDELPLISVLLPIFNGFPYLPRAIESICQQTETRWKLIAINDGSSDRTAEYLDSLTDSRIQVIHQANMGLTQSLNNGLEHCETKYIARMDCDDISWPDRFEKQVQFLEANPNVGLVGAQILRIGVRRDGDASKLPTGHDEIFKELMAGNHAICHPSIMCRKEAFDDIGQYRTGLGEEWDLFLRVGENWQLANLPEVLFSYRYHGTSINGSRMEELRQGIRYSCECSRHRRAKTEKPTYEEFVASEEQLPLGVRTTRIIECHARACYQKAMVDILGNNPIRGYVRLGVSATMAPHITARRIIEKLNVRK